MNPDSSPRKRTQKLKERLKEVAAEAILEAAEEVLFARGLEAPMEVIAARAGVAVGTLYNHFKDRRALVESLLEKHRERMLAEVHAAEQRSRDQDTRTQLTTMMSALVGSWTKIYLLVKQGEHLPDLKRRREIRRRFVTLFGEVIARGQAEGLIAPGDVALHTLALQGLMQAFMTQAADEPERLPGDRVVAEIVGRFLDGAGARARR
ncbi:MAG: TetR/AcrR family transcriptional regulator [Myxococcaceae bacterium]